MVLLKTKTKQNKTPENLQKQALYIANPRFGNPKREYKLKGLNLTNLIIKA